MSSFKIVAGTVSIFLLATAEFEYLKNKNNLADFNEYKKSLLTVNKQVYDTNYSNGHIVSIDTLVLVPKQSLEESKDTMIRPPLRSALEFFY